MSASPRSSVGTCLSALVRWRQLCVFVEKGVNMIWVTEILSQEDTYASENDKTLLKA
jgi:hypothetical protein